MLELQRWFRMVCFGGGTGLPRLLEGLRNLVFLELTAVVTAFDYGDRSKEIIDKHSLLSPSDMARCMLALSPHEDMYSIPLFSKAGKNKFTAMHILVSGGELLFGSRQRAFNEIYGILDIEEHHKVLPVTQEPKRQLCAKMKSGCTALNEPEVDRLIREGEIVENIFLDLPTKGNIDVVNAIDVADVLVVAPGSYYTSVLCNFLPAGTRDQNIKTHVENSSAPIFFVMNLVTEGRGMNHMSAKDIVEEAEKYLGRKIDRIIVNNSIPEGFDNIIEGFGVTMRERYELEGKYFIDPTPILDDPRTVPKNLWTNPESARHNSHKLANVVNKLATLWYIDHTIPPRAI